MRKIIGRILWGLVYALLAILTVCSIAAMIFWPEFRQAVWLYMKEHL